ncbi:MAG: asparaginase [Clostridia bacterium]|nr:asparaginase [Clostridia bacterium]
MLLATESRGELIENRHEGCVAVVGEEGLRYAGGRWGERMFFRSCSKPIQALPVFLLGLDKSYGLTDEECAIMAGSNAGEPICTEVAERLIEKAGVTDDDLVLRPRYPSHEPTKFAAIARGEGPRKVWHGCAPKHVGAILVQRELTGSGRGYHLPDSAAQRLIRYTISLFTGTPYERIALGTDGCGVPVFGVPGDAMAHAFLCLAAPDLIPEKGFADAARRITALMHRYPHLVRGNNYLCTVLNAADGVVAKGGASGVYCFGLKPERLGVMFKIADGTETAWQAITARIIRQIAPDGHGALLQKLETEELIGTVCREIRSLAGEAIGELRADFTLRRPGESRRGRELSEKS